jgi:hypothetical protein
MSENAAPKRHVQIDATELSSVEVVDDGRRLRLRLRDQDGRPAAVSLPVACLNTVLTALPRSADDLLAGGQGQVHRLDGWSLGQDADGPLLTLHLPDGARITLAIKLWQIAAMASLAGQAAAPPLGRLH